jgi:hypothetical protein
MTLQGIYDAKHWRDRAAEMRVLSDEMKDFEARTLMQIADRAEDRAARDMPKPSPIPKGR